MELFDRSRGMERVEIPEAGPALEGLGQLLRNVALVKSNLNPALDVKNRTAEIAVDLIESLFGKSTLMRR